MAREENKGHLFDTEIVFVKDEVGRQTIVEGKFAGLVLGFRKTEKGMQLVNSAELIIPVKPLKEGQTIVTSASRPVKHPVWVADEMSRLSLTAITDHPALDNIDPFGDIEKRIK